MYLVVFRNRKRADIDQAAYEAEAVRMEDLAREQPGYRSFKSYTADDGEVIALSEWADEASARAWGRLAEHRAAQARGRQAYYESYTLFACANPRIHAFPRACHAPVTLERQAMSMILYGIPNCDTVKKARSWLDERGLAHTLHDYKKAGADPAKLAEWSKALGWEALLNRRGTTFRKLDEADKADLDEAKALRLMAAHPSLIRRPLVEHNGGLLVGFDPAEWETALA